MVPGSGRSIRSCYYGKKPPLKTGESQGRRCQRQTLAEQRLNDKESL